MITVSIAGIDSQNIYFLKGHRFMVRRKKNKGAPRCTFFTLNIWKKFPVKVGETEIVTKFKRDLDRYWDRQPCFTRNLRRRSSFGKSWEKSAIWGPINSIQAYL